jgi:hypothetical protein
MSNIADSGLLPDLCYVENTGDQTYKFEWRDERTNKRQRMTSAPDKPPILMPRVAVNAWFGDPDLADHPTDPRRKSRTEALEKLCVRWGIFVGDPFEGRFPTELIVKDFEGNVLPTIHRDPYGDSLKPVDARTVELAEQAAQLDALQKAVKMLTAQIQASGDEVDHTVSISPPVAENDDESDLAVDPDAGALDEEPITGSAPKKRVAGAVKEKV